MLCCAARPKLDLRPKSKSFHHPPEHPNSLCLSAEKAALNARKQPSLEMPPTAVPAEETDSKGGPGKPTKGGPGEKCGFIGEGL